MSLLLHANSFSLTRSFEDTHRLMYKNSNSFLYIFVVNCTFFLNKSIEKSEQNLLSHRFIDICCCDFNLLFRFLRDFLSVSTSMVHVFPSLKYKLCYKLQFCDRIFLYLFISSQPIKEGSVNHFSANLCF